METANIWSADVQPRLTFILLAICVVVLSAHYICTAEHFLGFLCAHAFDVLLAMRNRAVKSVDYKTLFHQKMFLRWMRDLKVNFIPCEFF